MSHLTEQAVGEDVATPTHLSRPVIAGFLALMLGPVTGSIAGVVERVVLGPVDPDADSADSAAFLARVSEHSGLWTLGSVAMLAMLLLTAVWVPAVWRATVARTPVWAWVVAIVGTLFAGGQAVHLVSWWVLTPAMAASIEPGAATALVAALDDSWFFLLIFFPYLIGAVLSAPLAAVALRRARLIPTWGIIAVVVATIGIAVLGTSEPITIVGYPALLIAAFTPAVVRGVRRSRTA